MSSPGFASLKSCLFVPFFFSSSWFAFFSFSFLSWYIWFDDRSRFSLLSGWYIYIHVNIFVLCSVMCLGYLKSVWSFQVLLLIFVSLEQSSIPSLANLPHCWGFKTSVQPNFRICYNLVTTMNSLSSYFCIIIFIEVVLLLFFNWMCRWCGGKITLYFSFL